ncbi:MAG: hypothetical protein H0W20_01835 [Chthoniobacterales bacterium]|nr:hypothetical protein [Chthoniobacterales bacterium]
MTVNAPAGSIVILHHLEINGAGSGLQGINFINGGSLVVENCAFYGFTGSGINAAPTVADAKLQ